MQRLKYIGFILGLCAFETQAQVADGSLGYYNDALLFARTSSIGTARTQALGGAQVALGGDMGSAYANPAGLGFNRSSVFTITPSLNIYDSDTEYFGQQTTDSKANFNIANLGVIFNFSKGDIETSKFKGGSFAITMTRENNFHSEVRYKAKNTHNDLDPIGGSSIIDMWLDPINYDQDGNLDPVAIDNLSDFEYFGLYEQYLINPSYYINTDGNEQLDYYYKFIGENPIQQEIITKKGNQTEWNFSYGGNYDDILYFGASLGINTIKYESEFSYYESNFDFSGPPEEELNWLNTTNTLNVRGTGVSGTFGLILRPVDFFRIGVTAVTPTYYSMSEESSVSMQSEFKNPLELFDRYEEFFESSYELRTPGKVTTGAAIFLGKIGFISADVDFIDYSKAKLKSSEFATGFDNETIKSIYQNTINYRAGAEIRVSSIRLRGGYSYEGDPMIDNPIDQSVTKISGGVGYRNKEYFIDLSAVHSEWNTSRSPYEVPDFAYPTAYTANKNLNVSLTVGLNF